MTPATVTDLGGGVVRVTHPLPWALDHVHCYAIAAPAGWTIVDCGLGTPGTVERWRTALDALGRPAVRRVVVTHYHPDHVGASAALVELTGAVEVVQGRVDAALTELAWGDDADADAFAAYLEGHGMPAELARASALAEDDTPVRPAAPTRLVDEGDVVDCGAVSLRVLVLPGHADGHLALLDERGGRLFGGDVLLADITPNVGRWPDTAADPLGRYLDTLLRVEADPPSLVLPGHGPTIADAGDRAGEIRRHHAERLDAAEAALSAAPASAFAVATALWPEQLGFHEQRFALVEAISHLERLVATGRAREVAPGRFAAT
jgi:glyoxylase-like metal-dependent hydrolase (beta-lactamase superfamily II)